MAVVSIHMPLRMVSASATAIQRPTTVEHVVDRAVPIGRLGSAWQVHWDRVDNGRGREPGEPTGALHVRTLCGKEINGLPWTPQKRDPCRLCGKARREWRGTVVVHPPLWDETLAVYVDEQIHKYKRKEKKTLVERLEDDSPRQTAWGF